jgi:curli biogenesis system outer membrane secretion channel CsgG
MSSTGTTMTRWTGRVMAAALLLGGCGGRAAVKPEAAAAPTAPAVEAAADAPVIAVAKVAGTGVSDADAILVTDMIRQAMTATGRYRIVDRDHMEKVLQEQALKMAGVTSDADAANLGKLLNARYIGVGSYGTLLGANVVNFRIVDAETGLARKAGTAEGATLAELRKSIGSMVAGFGAL